MSVSPAHPTNSSAPQLKAKLSGACSRARPSVSDLTRTASLSVSKDLRGRLKDSNALPVEWNFSPHTLLLPDQYVLPENLSSYYPCQVARACLPVPLAPGDVMLSSGL